MRWCTQNKRGGENRFGSQSILGVVGSKRCGFNQVLTRSRFGGTTDQMYFRSLEFAVVQPGGPGT